jgi:imipenem/basic amino acid-specific outer membrane pore
MRIVKMFDIALPPQTVAMNDEQAPAVKEKHATQLQESGFLHSKQAGRYRVVTALPEEADSFDQMFDFADAFGVIRAGYINNDLPGNDTSATAIGGQFGFDTAAYRGVKFHAAAYTSQKFPVLNPGDESLAADFFDADGESFTYLAEANIAYEGETFQVTVGRMRLDMPYADSDDLRMAPNTFEGAWAHLDANEHIKVQAYFLSRWAGFDSGEDQDRFKVLYEDEEGDAGWGAAGLSASYLFDEENELSLWYYYIDKKSSIAYLEADAHHYFRDDLHLEYGLQGSTIKELSGSDVEGDTLGTFGILHYSGLFGGFAYNHAFVSGENVITDGFGGGPYYTSLDEATIGAVSEAAPGEDVDSWRVGVGLEFEPIGIDGLVVELMHGRMASDETVSILENDIIVTYDITQRWHFETAYAHYKDHKESNACFERLVMRLDYSF